MHSFVARYSLKSANFSSRMSYLKGNVAGEPSESSSLLLSSTPRGGTQHIHIRGGKSDIFGSEYCEK